MIKTQFRPPYKKNGRTSYPQAGKAGVYIIKKNGVVVYVGMSQSNVYKTLYRHFQSWSDPTQKRVTYQSQLTNRNKFLVRVIYTTPAQALRLEKYLIIKLKPKHNPDKLKSYQLKTTDVKQGEEYFKAPIEPCPF